MLALRFATRSLLQRPALFAASASRPTVTCLTLKPVAVSSLTGWRGFNSQADQDDVRAKSAWPEAFSKPAIRQRFKNLSIENLPLEATFGELQRLMAQFGDITNITLKIADTHGGSMRAVLHFRDADTADFALHAHKTQPFTIRGRELIIRSGETVNSPSCTIYIGNVSFEDTEEDIRELVRPFFEPKTIRYSNRGFAHVESPSLDGAKALVEAHAKLPIRDKQDRLLRLNYSHAGAVWNVLCIKGFDGTSEKLGEIFAQYGCTDGVEKVTAYRQNGENSGRPPLYFIHCQDIPTAVKIKETLQNAPGPLGFVIEYGNKPNSELRRQQTTRSF